jgi:clan AA aspartic protease (TIGR02281 family)
MKKFITLQLLFVCLVTSVFAQNIIQMRNDNDVMKIPCKVNGLNLEFILDTGASSVSISLSEALFMIKNGYLKTEDILEKEKYMTADGTIADGTKILIQEIQIGDYKLKNITGNITHSLVAPLLLGNSLLSKLGDISLNFSNATLAINDGKSYDFSGETLTSNVVDTMSARYFLEKGHTLYEKGESLPFGEGKEIIKEAILNYTKAIEINPTFYFAYSMRGYAKNALQDWQGTINDFDKALNLDSSHANIYFSRGNAKGNLGGKKLEAILDFSKAIELDPEYLEAYKIRALYKWSIKDWEGSIEDYNIAIKLEKNELELEGSYYYRALCKNALKDYQGAIEDFTNSNGYSDAIYLRGKAKLKMDDYQGAIADFSQELIKDSINDANAARTPAVTGSKYKKDDRTDLKLNSLGKNTASERINLLYCYRGLCKRSLNDYRGALSDFNKAIKIDAKDDWALTNRASTKALIKDYKGAIADLNLAITYNAENAEAYYIRGLIKILLKQKDSGCLDYSKAGELGYSEAYEKIKEDCN